MNNKFLTQVSEFVKLAIDASTMQAQQLNDQLYELKKQAAVRELEREKFRVALVKAANTLYDTDFLTGEEEKRTFLKKAAEDPLYVLRVLEKVCEAADVAQIGKPARIAAKPKEAEYDPVMEAAFGYKSGHDITDL